MTVMVQYLHKSDGRIQSRQLSLHLSICLVHSKPFLTQKVLHFACKKKKRKNNNNKLLAQDFTIFKQQRKKRKMSFPYLKQNNF
jgi:hypothetical protein